MPQRVVALDVFVETFNSNSKQLICPQKRDCGSESLKEGGGSNFFLLRLSSPHAAARADCWGRGRARIALANKHTQNRTPPLANFQAGFLHNTEIVKNARATRLWHNISTSSIFPQDNAGGGGLFGCARRVDKITRHVKFIARGCVYPPLGWRAYTAVPLRGAIRHASSMAFSILLV